MKSLNRHPNRVPILYVRRREGGNPALCELSWEKTVKITGFWLFCVLDHGKKL